MEPLIENNDARLDAVRRRILQHFVETNDLDSDCAERLFEVLGLECDMDDLKEWTEVSALDEELLFKESGIISSEPLELLTEPMKAARWEEELLDAMDLDIELDAIVDDDETFDRDKASPLSQNRLLIFLLFAKKAIEASEKPKEERERLQNLMAQALLHGELSQTIVWDLTEDAINQYLSLRIAYDHLSPAFKNPLIEEMRRHNEEIKVFLDEYLEDIKAEMAKTGITEANPDLDLRSGFREQLKKRLQEMDEKCQLGKCGASPFLK